MARQERSQTATHSVSRRDFVAQTSALTAAALSAGSSIAAESLDSPDETSTNRTTGQQQPFLTEADEFRDVSRGNPKPYTLQGDELTSARLTNGTWRLEITADSHVDDEVKLSAAIASPLTSADDTALTYDRLQELRKTYGVKFIKAMQCLNIPAPLGQGLWEGVPLRDVLGLCGHMENVRRIVYWGFHNNDPESHLKTAAYIDSVPKQVAIG